MRFYKKLSLFVMLFAANSVFASDALPVGEIKELSYRNGWVTLKVMGPEGQNYCDACPIDPGSRSTKKCWIEESKQFQLAMILSAQASGKKIYGRVVSFSTSCNIYQMSIVD